MPHHHLDNSKASETSSKQTLVRIRSWRILYCEVAPPDLLHNTQCLEMASVEMHFVSSLQDALWLAEAGTGPARRQSAACATHSSLFLHFSFTRFSEKDNSQDIVAIFALMAKLAIASSVAPTNIAIVKYWGKDVSRGGNTPINSSCSLTLDPEDLRAETVVVASSELEDDELILNGKKASTSNAHAIRLKACLELMRGKCAQLPPGCTAQSVDELKSWKVRIVSRNTFPTAAGLASSAAGYAALVRALASLYGIEESFEGELSTVARIGSGSACRSLYGGLVAWHKGEKLEDSKAQQLVSESHWPELRCAIIVLDAGEKDTPSTLGMQRSVETSPFLQYRAEAVAEPRVEQLQRAFEARDFDAFAKICMRDSNSFHATCLDTFPPISYMSDASRKVCKAVHAFNKMHGQALVAYSFDAGPNAVLFCKDDRARSEFVALLADVFRQAYLRPKGAIATNPDLLKTVATFDLWPNAIKMIYFTQIGTGAYSPMSDKGASLVDLATGMPCATTQTTSKFASRRFAALAALGLIFLVGFAKKRQA